MRRTLCAVLVGFIAVVAVSLNSPASAASKPGHKAMSAERACASETPAETYNSKLGRDSKSGPSIKSSVQAKRVSDSLWCMRVVTRAKHATGWQYTSTVTGEVISQTVSWTYGSWARKSAWLPVPTANDAMNFYGQVTLVKAKRSGATVTAQYSAEPILGVS